MVGQNRRATEAEQDLIDLERAAPMKEAGSVVRLK